MFPDMDLVNNSRGIYEDPDQVYETLNDDGNEITRNNQQGIAPDANIPTELEYTYAIDTEEPRANLDINIPSQDPVNNAMYHTLEDPEQMADHFYHYPDNTKESTVDLYKEPGTNIPTEQEYTDAKDTEIATTSFKATNDAVYHTLEQEDPASTYQERSYAKNIPSISLAIHFPSSPDSDHSLEQLSPPQAPLYSILEESSDVDNPTVSKNLTNLINLNFF